MSVSFIEGLTLGYVIKTGFYKRLAYIVLILDAGMTYFEVLNMEEIEKYLEMLGQYAPEIMHYAAIILGMMPLGLGFVVGCIVGLQI